jgi:hypothetical protein
MLPRMIQVKARIIALMADPVTGAGVYVRGIRMPRLIAKISMLFGSGPAMLVGLRFGAACRFRATCDRCVTVCVGCGTVCIGCGTVWRDVAMAHLVATGWVVGGRMAAGMFFAMLAERNPGVEKKRDEES